MTRNEQNPSTEGQQRIAQHFKLVSRAIIIFFFPPRLKANKLILVLYVESRIHLVLIDLITAIADNIIKNKSIWS